ncbi:MAG: dTMP kinase [Candidatus Omnitrophica bacterium]|nr:dTMP kinase [Candidatus Omnitrophota bacterium]
MRRGLFITFEGPEGSGKSTQARLLAAYLRRQGHRVVHTREPGGTRAGEAIRRVLLSTRFREISDATELFLYMACRRQLVDEVIAPALQRGRVVVCDRFLDATLAYQGYGGGVPLAQIRALGRVATGGLAPDLTVVLDVETRVGLRRAGRVKDRMERKELAYHQRVRQGYLALARREPRRIRVIRVTDGVAATQRQVRHLVRACLPRRR